MIDIYFGAFIGSLLGIALVSKFLEVRRDTQEERVVSALKDGVLALVVTQLHKNDVDNINTNMDYALYDGKRLPWLGEYSRMWFIERLQMLYLGDKENDKAAAVQKYLIKNFGNVNDTISFFEKVEDLFIRAEALTKESCASGEALAVPADSVKPRHRPGFLDSALRFNNGGVGEIQEEGDRGDNEARTGTTLGDIDIDWEDGVVAVDNAESKKRPIIYRDMAK